MANVRASCAVPFAVLLAGCVGASPRGDVLEPRLEVRADVRVVRMGVGPTEDLRNVLERAGVEPNGDGIALLYALNPGLVEKGRKESLMLQVPSVARPDKKDLAVLTIYASKKAEFQKRAKSVSDIVASVKRLPKERFATEEVKASLERKLSELDGLYMSLVRMIGSGKHALSPAFIDQLVAEATALRRHVADLVQGGKVIAATDLDPVAAILEDGRAQASCCDESMAVPAAPAPSDVIVSVHIRGSKGEVGNLRVTAVPVFSQDDPSERREFRLPSSPSEDRLPPARWVMWAVDPTTKKRVTDILTVLVRRGDEPVVVGLVYSQE